MDKKYIKPKSCLHCVVVEKSKDKVSCGCLRKLTARYDDAEELKAMYNKCPLKWDKE